MDDTLVCWKCGAPLGDIPVPLGRLAECLICHAELHVCRGCLFYDTQVAKHCRETIAEEVQDKVRANFCDYFQLRPNAYRPPDEREAVAARSQLESLFGGKSLDDEAAPDRPKSAEQQAREALESLFGPSRKEH